MPGLSSHTFLQVLAFSVCLLTVRNLLKPIPLPSQVHPASLEHSHSKFFVQGASPASLDPSGFVTKSLTSPLTTIPTSLTALKKGTAVNSTGSLMLLPIPGSSAKAREETFSLRNSSFLQVFVITAAGKEQYRDRFLANAAGWQKYFTDLPVFTFDEDAPKMLGGRVVTKIERLGSFEKSTKRNNLLMASFQAVHAHNPSADWYFMAEDDTILVKKNLERLLIPYRKGVYTGKCVTITKVKPHIDFIMGGSGILMSGDVVRRMAPTADICRKKFAQFYHGDTRVAACLDYLNIVPYDNITCESFFFTSASPWHEAKGKYAANLNFITMHEKDLNKIAYLNQAIEELEESGQPVKWSSMVPYLDRYTLINPIQTDNVTSL